jgi:hypothetical protein
MTRALASLMTDTEGDPAVRLLQAPGAAEDQVFKFEHLIGRDGDQVLNVEHLKSPTAAADSGPAIRLGCPVDDRWANVRDIVLDPELEALWVAPTPEQQAQIEQKLLREGCDERLVVWPRAGRLVLVSGYDKIRTLKFYEIPFRIIERPFPNRDAAGMWIIAEQLRRATLTPVARSHLLGLRYLEIKQPHGGDRRSCRPFAMAKSAEVVGEMSGYSASTVRRAAKVTQAVLQLASTSRAPQHIIAFLLSPAARLTCSKVIALSELDPSRQRELLAQLMYQGKLPRSWRSPPAPTPPSLPAQFQALLKKLLNRWGPQTTVAFAQFTLHSLTPAS